MKSFKEFVAEKKDCCKKCGSYDHISSQCPKEE